MLNLEDSFDYIKVAGSAKRLNIRHILPPDPLPLRQVVASTVTAEQLTCG